MNIPNWLTLFRIILIPIVVLVYYLPFMWKPVWWALPLSAALFTVAALTDLLDGYLARKLGQTTPFGAFLDPVADKLIVAAALVMLAEVHSNPWLTVPAIIIIGREIVISALREWMAELGKRASVAVSMIGKFKTTMQMIAIIVLLSQDPGTNLSIAGLVLLQVAAALTLWSMIVYLRAAWPELSPFKDAK